MGVRPQHSRAHQKRGGEHAPKATPPRGRDRSDVVLQMLDDATQGFTYDGWERDAKSQESRWVHGSSTAAGIKSAVERMRRKQRLHDSSLDLFSGTAGARPPQAGFPGLSDGVIRRARACLICLSVFYLGVYSCSALP